MRGKKLMPGLMGLMISAIMNITLVPAQATSFAEIERGRYLSRVGDCIACHTAEGGNHLPAGGLFPHHSASSIQLTSLPTKKLESVHGRERISITPCMKVSTMKAIISTPPFHTRGSPG
jgi:mono/diheme cytochrome c family protein